jgi:hypothetical protein
MVVLELNHSVYYLTHLTTADVMSSHLQRPYSSLHISCVQIAGMMICPENQMSHEISGVFLYCHQMWKTENTMLNN